jgi:uncharacterized repeat protein (TIGR04042 family)
MPEMNFSLRWPDHSETKHYSPSLVIEDFFSAGESYQLPDFLRRAQDALTIASDRVEQKYGFPCSRARASLADIEQRAGNFAADKSVKIQEFFR